MLNITESILIDCTPREAWALFHDLNLRPVWDRNVQELSWIEGRGPAVGSRMKGVSRAAGLTVHWEAEVVENTPPRRHSVKSVSGPFPFTATMTFEPFAGTTRFSWTAVGEPSPGWLGKVAAEVAARSYRKELRANLERFRTLVRVTLSGQGDHEMASTNAPVSRS